MGSMGLCKGLVVAKLLSFAGVNDRDQKHSNRV